MVVDRLKMNRSKVRNAGFRVLNQSDKKWWHFFTLNRVL